MRRIWVALTLTLVLLGLAVPSFAAPGFVSDKTDSTQSVGFTALKDAGVDVSQTMTASEKASVVGGRYIFYAGPFGTGDNWFGCQLQVAYNRLTLNWRGYSVENRFGGICGYVVWANR